MVAARPYQSTSGSAADDLRKQVIHLMQADSEEAKSNILVLPQVFLEFLDYDHKAALFLNKLLYWTERTKHPQKWIYKTYAGWYAELGFKESVIRRLLYGDPRAQTRKRTLIDIGVEVKVMRAPNGSPTCHYRINLTVFLDAVRQFLAAKQGAVFMSEAGQRAGSTLGIAQDRTPALQSLESPQCAETYDHQTTIQISSEGITPESSCASRHDDDLEIFLAYESRFGKLKEHFAGTFRTELARLGASRAGEVVARCATHGRSWSYVAKALANEQPDEAPSESVLHWGAAVEFGAVDSQTPDLQPAEAASGGWISPRVETLWQRANEPPTTVRCVWQAALQQLELQTGCSFYTWGQGLTLVDFEPETQTFILLARNRHAQALLRGRLDRTVRRILRDVYGQHVCVTYLRPDEWPSERGEPSA